MTVYVDEAVWPLGRMVMCHMVADSHKELMEFAANLGMKPQWLQNPGTHKEHFDLSKGKRQLAIQMGAVPVSGRQLVGIVRAKRATAEQESTDDASKENSPRGP